MRIKGNILLIILTIASLIVSTPSLAAPANAGTTSPKPNASESASTAPQTQDRNKGGKSKDGTTLKTGKGSYRSIIGATRNAGAVRGAATNMNYKGTYTDSRLGDLEKEMAERDWTNEETAWQRACKMGTKEGYQKYMAKFPNGAHVAEANSKLMEIDVEDAFSKPHNDMPQWECVEKDETSETSTISITNHTDYPMTVEFSGVTARSIVIPPYGTSSVTLVNDDYKVAASVPNPNVRPFAGIQVLGGGRYKTNFYIVRQ